MRAWFSCRVGKVTLSFIVEAILVLVAASPKQARERPLCSFTGLCSSFWVARYDFGMKGCACLKPVLSPENGAALFCTTRGSPRLFSLPKYELMYFLWTNCNVLFAKNTIPFPPRDTCILRVKEFVLICIYFACQTNFYTNEILKTIPCSRGDRN